MSILSRPIFTFDSQQNNNRKLYKKRMDKDRSSDQIPAEDRKGPAKKPASVGLFAGMNVKKKVSKTPEIIAPPELPANDKQADDTPRKQSANSLNNKSANSEAEKIHNNSSTQNAVQDNTDILEFSEKKKQLPFFKNARASKTQKPPQEQNEDNDLFQFSGKKNQMFSEQAATGTVYSGDLAKGSDDILDFDLNSLQAKIPTNTPEDQNSFNVVSKAPQSDSQQIEHDSFDLLGISKDDKKSVNSSINKKGNETSQSDSLTLVSEKIERPQKSNTNPKNELENQQLQVSESKSTKKTFGFIKKTKEQPQVPRAELAPMSKEEAKADKIFSEDQPVPTADNNLNENSFNEYSNTLDKINKDLSEISDKVAFKDDIEKTPDSKSDSKDRIFSQNTSKEKLRFAEKIRRDFKVDQLENRVGGRFNRFLSEIFSFVQKHNNQHRQEESSKNKKKELTTTLRSLEQQLQAKLQDEDYVAAETLQARIDTLAGEFESADNAKDAEEHTKDLQDSVQFEKLKADFSSELNKLMGDKIFIKEKRMFYQEDSKENFQRRKEALEDSRQRARSELEQVRKTRAAAEALVTECEGRMRKETSTLHSQIERLKSDRQVLEKEIEELRKLLVKKENEIFELDRNVQTAFEQISTVEAKFLPQLSTLETKREREAEAELVVAVRLEDLADQERELTAAVQDFDDQLKSVDGIIAKIDDLREKYKAFLESFEGLFRKLAANNAKSVAAKSQYKNRRSEWESLAFQLERGREEVAKLAVEVAKTTGELEKAQSELPMADVRKKAAVKEKNFSLANFHSKEFKRLEQLEASLKEELTGQLTRLEEAQKDLPAIEEKLTELERQAAPEQLAYTRSLADTVDLRISIFEKISAIDEKISDSLADEIAFCKNMRDDLQKQEREISKILEDKSSTAETHFKEQTTDHLNASFIEAQSESNLTETNPEKPTGSIDIELKDIIKNDNEEEAWENYASLHRATKEQAELEAKLVDILAQEDYEEAAKVQSRLDELEKNKKDSQARIAATEVYLPVPEEERRAKYIEHLQKRIQNLQDDQKDVQEAERERFEARLAHLQKKMADFTSE